MKVITIYDYFELDKSHPWYYIRKKIRKISTDKSIVFVDYMDKYFNKFFYNKIKLHNTNVVLYEKDAYYLAEGDEKKTSLFLHDNQVYKWNNESQQFLKTKCDIKKLKKKYNVGTIKEKWVGIIHYPEFKKEMNFHSDESLPMIIQSPHFIESIKNCIAIITLSEYCKMYVKQYLPNIPIHVIYHPLYERLKNNSKSLMLYKNLNVNMSNFDVQLNLVQVGFWMRQMDAIYKINTKRFKKYWLPGGKFWKNMFQTVCPEANHYLENESIFISDTNSRLQNNNDKVNILQDLSTHDYIHFIRNQYNLLIMFVYNSSANNTILECITYNIPIILNKHYAIMEYLGTMYPLYFDDIEQVNNFLSGDIEMILKKMNECKIYLENLDKTRFQIKYFTKNIKKILELKK